MADTKSIWITVLGLIVVIMALVMIYAFVIQPAISGYSVQKQSEGVQIAVNAILTQLQQNGYVQIPVGGKTLILVPYVPPTAQASAQTATQTTQAPTNQTP